MTVFVDIFVLVGRLNPDAFESRVSEWRRGGLPAASMSEGSRGSESPLPRSDRMDRLLARAAKDHRKLLAEALRALREVERLENSIAALPHEEASKLAAELVAPKAVACSNCKRIVERTPADRLLGGRCRNCHDYWNAHGKVERPRELWESEIEKRARDLENRRSNPTERHDYKKRRSA